MRQITFFLLFLANQAFTQKSEVFLIDGLSTDVSSGTREGILLNKGWVFQTGDNLDWAKPGFDDSAWTPIDPTKEIFALPQIFNAKIKWLRLDFEVKNKLPNPLGIAVNQAGASEIYLNGRLIHQFGHFDTDSTKVKAFDPLEHPIYFPADSIGQYTLAVRYALQPNIRYTNLFTLTKNRLFNATMLNLVPTLHAQRDFTVYYLGLEIFVIGVFFMLFVFHFAFYMYQRSNTIHLLLAIFLLGNAVVRIVKIIGQNQNLVEERYFSLNISNCVFGIVVLCLWSVYYRMAKVRLDIYYYALIFFTFVRVVVSSMTYGYPWHSVLLLLGTFLGFMILLRLTAISLKKRIRGYWILGVAAICQILGLACITVAVLFWNYGISPTGYKVLSYGISPYLIDAIFTFGSIATPIGLSLFMGIQGSEINKALSKQLTENEQLKNKAIENEQEKQHFLATQNDMLEKQVKERTSELNLSLETLKATQNQLIQSEKLASLGELTAGIAHEIQNPLNFVNNFSELSVDLVKDLKIEMEKSPLTPEGGLIISSKDKGYIDELFGDLTTNQEKINHHGKRASGIVKGMLEHSRASTGVRELTEINKLADEYLRISYRGFRAKDKDFDANFTTDFEDNLPKTEVVPQDMGRVLLNLINNAFYAVNQRATQLHSVNFKSSPNVGANVGAKSYTPSVSVTTQQLDNQITIRIKDNGTGMPESVRTKVFQPFFTTKPTGIATGLGLSLAYDIVTRGHGGTLEVESTEGVGSAFIITLPLKIN
jgi:two-component system, NtrC family, sensor kinase